MECCAEIGVDHCAPKLISSCRSAGLVGLLALAAQPAHAQARKSKSQPSIARKAASARARRRHPREMVDTTVPRYKVDASGDLIRISAPPRDHLQPAHEPGALGRELTGSAVDCEHHESDDRDRVSRKQSRPLEEVAIVRGDVYAASTTKLLVNDKVTTDDCCTCCSSHPTTPPPAQLARVSPQGSDGFIDRMNQKAIELGLQSRTTPIRRGSVRQRVLGATCAPHRSRVCRRSHRLHHAHAEYDPIEAAIDRFRSTDHLLGRTDIDVRAAKTGFISKSGYCLATLLRCHKVDGKWRLSCSARARMPGASWKLKISSTG